MKTNKMFLSEENSKKHKNEIKLDRQKFTIGKIHGNASDKKAVYFIWNEKNMGIFRIMEL